MEIIKNILVIDDDSSDRVLLVRSVKRVSGTIKVTEAWDMDTAETQLRKRDYDCIFLDFELGSINGLTLLKIILGKRLTSAPIIILSGVNDPVLMLECLRAGAQDYLLKAEINSTILARSIRHAKERMDLTHQLRYIAQHDQLTGLANRETFLSGVSLAISRVRRHGMHFAVFFLDLDHFKDVNDTYGHDVGDILLKKVANRIQSSVRESDIVGRLGGDEFAILLDDLKTKETIIEIAQKTLDNIGHTLNINGIDIKVTPSIGIALCPSDTDVADELLQYADMAMYYAKSEGRNKYSFFADEMRQLALKQSLIKKELICAIEREEFELLYQPQIEIETDKIIGVEALIRWNHPDRGLISPNDFIPIAEETGLILQIGEWVVAKACNQLQIWSSAGIITDQNFSMSVNISACQIRQGKTIDIIETFLKKKDFTNNQLVLEITESMLIEDIDRSVQALKKISDQGVSIAIDDFGTGFASFRHLLLLPLTYLKIDKIFIDKIATDQMGAEIISGIIAMAKAVNLKVVAEGVEHKEQLEQLQKMDCNRYQGYLYSRPIPIDKITSLLTQQKSA